MTVLYTYMSFVSFAFLFNLQSNKNKKRTIIQKKKTHLKEIIIYKKKEKKIKQSYLYV